MNRFERWSVWISATLVTASGVGLLWAKYFVHNDDPWSLINHPLQPWFLKAHILTAPLLIAALGQIAVRHVWRHFRNAVTRGRHSGVITAAVSLPLVLGGYLIQVVTNEAWVLILAVAHIALGGLFAVGILIHSFAVGRPRSQAPPADRPERLEQVGVAGTTGERTEALSDLARKGVGRGSAAEGRLKTFHIRWTKAAERRGLFPRPRR